MINMQSTFHTAPDLCINVSLPCYLVDTVIHTRTRTVCTQICVYIHTCCAQYRTAGRAKEIKQFGTAVIAACQGDLVCSLHGCVM